MVFLVFDNLGSLLVLLSSFICVIFFYNSFSFNVSFGGGMSSRGELILVWSVGIFIIFINLWGVIPTNFHMTTQVIYVWLFSFLIFLPILLSNFMWDFCKFWGCLTPTSVPIIIVPLLNFVELISLLVRPLTLTLRLCINMGAGQLIMGLVGSSLTSVFVVFLVCCLFLLFELAVCCIQGVVYGLLIGVYFSESH